MENGYRLGTSNWDICFDANLKLSKVLSERNVHHWLDIRQDRSHDWPLWKDVSSLLIPNQIF
jgi:esterase/lipase superfamily enzyme